MTMPCCPFLSSIFIALMFVSLTDPTIPTDVSIPFENFAKRHIMFADFNPDHLLLCSEQQQQWQNKPKHGKFICAFFSTFPSQKMFIAE